MKNPIEMTDHELAEAYADAQRRAETIADEIKTFVAGTAQKATALELKKLAAEIQARPEIDQTVLSGNTHRRLVVKPTEKVTIEKMTPEILHRLVSEYDKTGVWPLPHTIAASRFREIWPTRAPSWAVVKDDHAISFTIDRD